VVDLSSDIVQLNRLRQRYIGYVMEILPALLIESNQSRFKSSNIRCRSYTQCIRMYFSGMLYIVTCVQRLLTEGFYKGDNSFFLTTFTDL